MTININCNQIKKAVETALEIEDVTLKTRKQKIVIARQLYCFFAKKYTKEKLYTIGQFVDLSHATVVHSIHKIKNDLKLSYPKIIMPHQKCSKEIEKIVFSDIENVKILIADYQSKINELKKYLNE